MPGETYLTSIKTLKPNRITTPRRNARRQRSKTEKKQILAKWRSDLRPVELSRLLNVPRSTIFAWARRYGLTYRKIRMEPKPPMSTKVKSYVLRQCGLRGFEITLPRYIVAQLGLKAGDRLDFQLLEKSCVIKKTNGDDLPKQAIEMPLHG
jgi:hypothetical protein